MTSSDTQAMEDSAALDAARARHPSAYADRLGCDQCDADGRGRVTPCAEHRVFALHRTYVGEPAFGPCSVTVTESVLATGEVLASWPLRPLAAEDNGYAWGYAGRGPTILADALLADALGETTDAVETLSFRDEVVGSWAVGEAFGTSQADVLAWAYAFRGHKGGSALRPPRRAIDTEIANAIIPTLRSAQ